MQVGFNKRRASAYRLAAQLISEPEFGAVTSVELTYFELARPGLRLHLIDMSIHALDMVRWLLGDPVRIAVLQARQIGDNHVLALMIEHESRRGLPTRAVGVRAGRPGSVWRSLATGRPCGSTACGSSDVRHARPTALSAEEANTRVTRSWAPEFSLPDKQNDMQVDPGLRDRADRVREAVRQRREVSPSIDDGVAAMRMIEAIAAGARRDVGARPPRRACLKRERV